MSSWLTFFARNLRKQSTDAERKLWWCLRAKQFSGLKFRRQQVIGNYIVDFVCFSKKIIIELDGSQHMKASNKLQDKIRDQWLKKQGFIVLRFWDNEVLQNIEGVREIIFKYCHPHPNPPPSRGREIVK